LAGAQRFNAVGPLKLQPRHIAQPVALSGLVKRNPQFNHGGSVLVFTPRDEEVVRVYSDLMGEVRLRIDAINRGLAGALGLKGPLVREFCFLQFRMICELIALACLTAHGDIATVKNPKIQKEWSAEKIIEALSGLHPDFYPEPVRETPGIPPVRTDFVPLDKDFLTKAELVSLAGKCGNILHRGSIKKLLSDKTPTQTNFPEIQSIAQKIANLVSVHRVSLITPGRLYVCIFLADGRVQTFLAEAIGKT
jgi:hypothetical protein